MAFKCKAGYRVRLTSKGKWELNYLNQNGGCRFIEEFGSEYAAEEAKCVAEGEMKRRQRERAA